jgi:hypothetical protein
LHAVHCCVKRVEANSKEKKVGAVAIDINYKHWELYSAKEAKDGKEKKDRDWEKIVDDVVMHKNPKDFDKAKCNTIN